MEKISIPKINLIYSKDKLLELANQLNDDSKATASLAETKIKQHIFSFCKQIYDCLLTIEKSLDCFRAQQFFIDNEIKNMALIYSMFPDTFDIIFAYNEFRCIDVNNNRNCIGIFNFDTVTNENFLHECIRDAHIKAAESLLRSIEHAKRDIERFNADINTLKNICYA